MTRPPMTHTRTSRHLVLVPRQTDAGADMTLHFVAASLARGSMTHLVTSVRNCARGARAKGDSVEDVVKQLMDLVHNATPDQATRAKRSSDVAGWAIDAYFEAPAVQCVWRQATVARWLRDSSRSNGV